MVYYTYQSCGWWKGNGTNETHHRNRRTSRPTRDAPKDPKCCYPGDMSRRMPVSSLILGYYRTPGNCRIPALKILLKASTKNKRPQTVMCVPATHSFVVRTILQQNNTRTNITQLTVANISKIAIMRNKDIIISNRKAKPGLGIKVNRPPPPLQDSKSYSLLSEIPHHFKLQYQFGRSFSRHENVPCWVCSHMGTGRTQMPMVGKPVSLELLTNQTDIHEVANITIRPNPIIFSGYTDEPDFCFLNGASLIEGGIPNGEFCRNTKVNFTLRDVQKFLADRSFEIMGLNTTTIADADERVGNYTLYRISDCVHARHGMDKTPLHDWLKTYHMEDPFFTPDSTPSLGDWLCLVGLRSGRSVQNEVSPAPHLPRGWMVCCGLTCHTSIPIPIDPETGGWCTLAQMIPYMGISGDSQTVHMVPAHGTLSFSRPKRAVTTWWEKLLASIGGIGMWSALENIDKYADIILGLINSSSRDINLLNEETLKLRMQQELIIIHQEQMLAAITGLCNLMDDKDMCCTYIHNFTTPIEHLTVPDYHDIIQNHATQRSMLLEQARTFADDWNPFSGVGGWFGGVWSNITGFFKKIGIVLLLVIALFFSIYLVVKLVFCILGKTGKLKISKEPTPDPNLLLSLLPPKERWWYDNAM